MVWCQKTQCTAPSIVKTWVVRNCNTNSLKLFLEFKFLKFNVYPQVMGQKELKAECTASQNLPNIYAVHPACLD
jgi:hypothetical protein